jgi:hypothetical protein
MRGLTVLAVGAMAALAVATSGARPALAAPRPNLADLVPANYRVLKVFQARLSGQPVPEVVVTSVGPLNQHELHPANLQVLSWDPKAYRWNVVFDAQRVRFESAPLIDPAAAVQVGRVAFVRFFPGSGRELVFAASWSGATGLRSELVVVDFRRGEAGIDYFWSGDWGVTFHPTGTAANPGVVATAPYRTISDPHTQAVRSYRFTVGVRNGALRMLHDDRPWVGLLVTGTDRSATNPVGTPTSHLRVTGVVPGSPAAKPFRVGDVIVGLTGPRTARTANLLGPALVDDVAAQQAGDRVRFAVLRDGRYLPVTIRLGSLLDPSATSAVPPTDPSVALV